MVVGCGSQMLMREDTVPSLGLEGGQEVYHLVKGRRTTGPTLCAPGVSFTAAVTAATCQEGLGGVGGEPTSWYRAGQKSARVNLESDLKI